MTIRIARNAFFVVLAVVVLAVALLLTVDLGRFRPQIETAVSEALQREFEIAGPLHVDLGAMTAVSAEGLRIAGAGWGPESLLEVGRIAVSLDTWSLIGGGPVVIDRLEVDRLQVSLEQDREGRKNWTLGAGAGETETAASPGRLSLPVRLDAARIADMTLTYHTAAMAAPVEVTSALSEIRTTDPDGLTVSSTGAVNGTPFRLAAGAGDFAGLMALAALRVVADGNLGEIAFDAALGIDDVQHPSRPVVDLKLSGPDVEYLTELLNLSPITTGPLELESRIAPDGEDMRVTVSGRFGEFTTLVTGRFVDLRNLDDADLQVAASGPNTAHVAGLFGIEGVPADPFNVVGTVHRAGGGLSVEGVTVTIGETQFGLEGNFRRFPNPDGAVASLHVEGPDIGRFKRLMGLSGPLEGAFRLNAELEPIDSGGARLAVDGSTSDVRFSIAGDFTAADALVGSRARVRYSGSDLRTITNALGVENMPDHAFEGSAVLERTTDGLRVEDGHVIVGPDELILDGLVALGAGLRGTSLNVSATIPAPRDSLASYGIELGNLPNEAIGLSGGLALDDSGLALEDVAVRSGQLSARLAGRLGLPAVTSGTDIAFTIDGSDFRSLIPDNPAFRGLDRPFSLAGQVVFDGRRARLPALQFGIDESRLEADIDVSLDAAAPAGNVSLRASSPDLYRLSPDLESVSMPGTLPSELRIEASLANDLLTVSVFEALIGKGRIDVHGTVEGPPGFDRTDLDVEVHIDNLRQLSMLAGRELPEQPVDVSGRLAGRSDAVRLENFTARLGESDLEGSIEYRAGDTPAVSVAMRSDHFDLTPYRPPAAGTDDEPAATPAPDRRLIPGEPLPFERLHGIRADATVEIGTIRDHQKTFNDFSFVATLEGGELRVSDFSVDTDGGGKLWGRFAVTSRGADAEVRMRLYGTHLVIGLPAETPEELEALPRYDLNLAFVTNGGTPRELAGNMNGYLKFTSGEGRIRTGAMRMFTNDFLYELLNTVNPFVRSSVYTQLNCTVVLATVEDGQLAGKPAMVIQSDRLSMFANAAIDLKTERLDASFNTAPSKGLGISLSNLVNPYVKVQGSLARPQLAIDPQGALIEGGTAVATGGLSILAKGLKDRFFSAKDPCAVAVKDAEAQFAALEQKYADNPE